MRAEARRAGPGAFLNFGSRPEEGGGGEVVLKRSLPDWLPEPPLRVLVLHAEFLRAVGVGIAKEVGDDAVPGGVEACDDGVVVGKGEGRVDRNHPRFGLRAVDAQAVNVRRGRLVVVTPAEAVRRDENHQGLIQLRKRPRRAPSCRAGRSARAASERSQHQPHHHAVEKRKRHPPQQPVPPRSAVRGRRL